MKTALLTVALLLSLCVATCIGLGCTMYHRAPLYLYTQANGQVTESLVIIRTTWADAVSSDTPRLYTVLDGLAGIGLVLRDVVRPSGERILPATGDAAAFAAIVRQLQPPAPWTTAYSQNLTSADLTYYNGMAQVSHAAR